MNYNNNHNSNNNNNNNVKSNHINNINNINHNNKWGPLPRYSYLSSSSSSSSLKKSTALKNKEGDEDCVKTTDILSLDSIRSTLIRQEETIIFALIERAQFRQNDKCYDQDGFENLGSRFGKTSNDDSNKLSLLEHMLMGTEALHSRVRRYTSPEEHSFFPERLPDFRRPKGEGLPELDYPTDLLSSSGGASSINFNKILLQKYTSWILPKMSQPGDDEQHGSAVVCDIAVLQALSRRVHYGKFVAESKYRSDPKAYQQLVQDNDADGVMKLLTNAPVEEKVLQRAKLKAATYGREPLSNIAIPNLECNDTASIVAAAAASAAAAAVEALVGGDFSQKKRGKVNPTVIEAIYRDFIIPLTKDIEVAYLFLRCGKQPPKEYGPDRMSTDPSILVKEEEETANGTTANGTTATTTTTNHQSA
uniref:chorismate mutase n=1 Tax=Eucampia antarctica TaxID=49252 RepID=A0A7S2VZ80_9STRA|mmetsp:Transcript_12487/g.12105  ORF Transcript_12487/g.12105 Transcript_12487/m.12105 type:complete len:420 (+) Transcript_12487:230-1489(+)